MPTSKRGERDARQTLLSLCPCGHAWISHNHQSGCAYANCACNLPRPSGLPKLDLVYVPVNRIPGPTLMAGDESTPECDYCGNAALLIIYCKCRHSYQHNFNQTCGRANCKRHAREFVGRAACGVKTGNIGEVDTESLRGPTSKAATKAARGSTTCRKCGADKKSGVRCAVCRRRLNAQAYLSRNAIPTMSEPS